ncbi:unnamed protein product [Phaeothamnion confervicola]
MTPNQAILPITGNEEAHAEEMLSRAFFALSDPVRRAILERLREAPLLVSELAAPFDISLQAVSKHIQVLVRAGLVQQSRTGRISTCSLDIGPMFSAAVWINRYSHYWQAQFDTLAGALQDIDRRNIPPRKSHGKPKPKTRKDRPAAQK